VRLEGQRRIFLDVEKALALDDGIEPGVVGPDRRRIDRDVDGPLLRRTIEGHFAGDLPEIPALGRKADVACLPLRLRMNGIQHVGFLRGHGQRKADTESGNEHANDHGVSPDLGGWVPTWDVESGASANSVTTLPIP